MISVPVRARLAWGAALVLAGTGMFACYLLQSRTNGINSDGGGIALLAWDMLHGNWLLHGWWLADVSFYTTEVPELMLVEAVRGLGPDAVHVSAALTYTLLVLTTALVARGQARGREGVVRALVGGGIMVAPALGHATNVLLEWPDHTGTGVPIMVILLLLDRARQRWYVPVALMAALAWVQVGDSLATFAVAIPIALVGLARAFAGWLRHTDRAALWYDLSLTAAATASVALANVAVTVIHALGGFYQHPLVGPLLASPSALPHQARAVGESVLVLFGADVIGTPAGLSFWFALVHLVGVALAVLGLLAGIRGFFSRLDRVAQILVVSTLMVLAAGWLGTHVTDLFGAHEIAVVLPLGAALAGRLLGAGVVRARLEPVLAVLLAAYLAMLGYDATPPSVPSANQELATWLVSHHLHNGLAGYWQADIVTLETGGRVTVAPLSFNYPYAWESQSAWYDPRVTYANFVVTVSSPPAEAVLAQPNVMRRKFGPPARTYHFHQYTIMIWNKNLLTQLPRPSP